MRILFLSNYYPPFARGGYEQWCHDVGVELAQRGHQVCVVTSRVPDAHGSVDDHDVQVRRILHLEVQSGLASTIARLLFARPRLERQNVEQLRSVVAEFQPEAALLWGMWNVPRSVPACIEALMPAQVAYYLCDYWLSLPSSYLLQLQNPATRRLTSWPKRLISLPFLFQLKREPIIPLQLRRPICVSCAVRDLLVQANVPIQHAEIIYGGVQPEEFTAVAERREGRASDGLKLLYAGRLDPEKGVHTAIRAMSLITPREDRPVTLDIVGTGDAVYERGLRALVEQNRLHERVAFRGTVSRAEMPQVLGQYDALVFPSEWNEPFARTVLEAMAAGLIVIGTTTGGTAEVLVEGQTGLTFPRGDPAQLARQIQRLRDDEALCLALAEMARRCVAEKFTFRRMTAQLEAALCELGASAKTSVFVRDSGSRTMAVEQNLV